MKILELEKEYIELQRFLTEPSSRRTKLIRIFEFYDLVLTSSNPNMIEVYISEFLPKYFTFMKLVKIRGLNPDILVNLEDQLIKISKFDFVLNYKQEVEDSFKVLKTKSELLSLWMNGHSTNPENNLIYFPVLEKSESTRVLGFLEIIKVVISAGENKFIIEPAESEEDDLLEKQLHLCWDVAVAYCKKHIKKIKTNHTVELKFENKLGVYVGNSFGIALTLAFIEALLKHYNSSTIVNVNDCIAVTGGIDKDSKIISTGKTTIESKVETVFYSDAHIFCLPKTDEIWAEKKLLELKKLYPNRDLKIVGLTDLDDLLNRRNVVDIRRQKVIVRTAKVIKKNWVNAIATILLAFLFAFLFVIDYDDNPASLKADGNLLYVKNKNGKVLWSKLVNTNDINLSREAKVVDIDNDNQNEILICKVRDPQTKLIKNMAMIDCYNSNGEEIWNYTFKDKVLSEREILNTEYTVNILDTLTFSGQKSLLLIASNGPSFSSAIFRLNLKTGQRLPGTFWASGHIIDALTFDFNNNGIIDVIGAGYDNGYEDLVFFGYELKASICVRPTQDEYLIKSYPIADMMVYIRFPKTDFDNLFEDRTPGYQTNSLIRQDNFKKFSFVATIPEKYPEAGLGYEVDYNFKNINVVIDSDFRVQRDTLVAKGILKLPFTDTEEYKNIIKSNILYWKNGKWVKRDELD